jgi:DNA mismatch endonuclease (patch repair protein)
MAATARAKRATAIVSGAMRAVRGANTAPEAALRSALAAAGYRPSRSVAATRLPGRPDLVFPRCRVAVFVDGDFWHGRQWRTRGFASIESHFKGINNEAYWIRKIRGNVARDRRVTRTLRAAGWIVVRVWESDVRRDADKCVRRIARALERVERYPIRRRA